VEARATLAKPLEDRIFFAGEATSGDHYATAHGAFTSGQRAAREALALAADQTLG
jgi:monoamine oxidase